MLMVLWIDTKLDGYFMGSLNDLVLIMTKPSALLSSQLRFILSLLWLIPGTVWYIILMWRTLFFMGHCQKQYIALNPLGLLILLFLDMFASSTSHYTIWSRHREHGTTGLLLFYYHWGSLKPSMTPLFSYTSATLRECTCFSMWMILFLQHPLSNSYARSLLHYNRNLLWKISVLYIIFLEWQFSISTPWTSLLTMAWATASLAPPLSTLVLIFLLMSNLLLLIL
jgi:hypothetical protein